MSWAVQHQIKLRQRAVQIFQELNEEEVLVKNLLAHQNLVDKEENCLANAQNEELKYVLGVLAEHRKLEEKRQKEYELLFN